MRRGGLVAALAASVVGLATGQMELLVLAVVPLGYALFGELSGRPDPELAVERHVSTREPLPGEEVEVTLEVRNEGDRPLADVRVADRPPEGVPAEGETAVAAALRPGESVRVSYALSPPRGTHEFDAPVVRPRSLAGVADDQRSVPATGDDTVVCQTLLDEVPLADQTIQYVGRTPTDSGGAGVEFYATREYRRGDPLSRIDWSRYARTGDLSTVELREERALTVVFLVDDRPDVQRTVPGYGPDSLDLASYAVSRALPTLLDDNHRVGVATATGLAEADRMVEPGSGPATEAAVDDALDEAGTLADGGTTDPRSIAETLVARLPPGAQVVCCSPLSDDFVAGAADVISSSGHTVTVLSPDLPGHAGDDSPGRTLAITERARRVRALERRGIAVADWDLDDPLALALSRTVDTWRGSR